MIKTPKPGSFVEVKQTTNNGERIQTGTVLPRGELFAEGILVLKLENGYNVGISHTHISDIVVLKEPVKQKKETISRKTDPHLPNVAFLSFGGTISSRLDYKTGGVVADYDANDFYEMMPELTTIANILPERVASMMSEDMGISDYESMATAIKPYLDDDSIKGIVVTQGTDTLHYTTAALSFLLGSLSKPVIFTASQRSIDRGSSDAFENIICAVTAATSWDGACVVTCMHETTNDGSCILIRGTKVRKMHTSRRDAFRPINEQALARVTPSGDMVILNERYVKRTDMRDTAHCFSHKMESKIALLHIFPSMTADQIDFFAKEKYKGLVLSATAFGHIPEQLLASVYALAEKIPIIITSQSLYGRVNALVYSRLREMSIGGNLFFVGDMLPETAYVKLSWALAQKTKKEDVLTLMRKNIAGEYAGEIDEKSFLN